VLAAIAFLAMSSTGSFATSRRIVRDGAYASPHKLAVRKSLYRHADVSPPPPDQPIREAIALCGEERVIDVGCGTGQYVAALRETGHQGPLVALDLSEGMLASVDGTCAQKVVGDASALPLATGIADVVLAMSMLYHVPDIAAAVREFRRVLRTGGILLASTSSADDKPEIYDVWSEAMSHVAGREIDLRQTAVRFTTENGSAILGACFTDVHINAWSVTLRVPSATEIRDYADSARDFYESLLPDPERWSRAMDLTEQFAAERINRDGHFVVTIKKCMFVCR
jgi:SAM-dependent methyltransferase